MMAPWICMGLPTIQLVGLLGNWVLSTKTERRSVKWFSCGCVGLALLVLLMMYPYIVFDQTGRDVFSFKVNWLYDIGATFSLGIDGLSYILLLMSVIVHLAIVLQIDLGETSVAEKIAVMFVVQLFSMLLFMARDGLLFFLCFEGSLIPVFMAIGVWGGEHRFFAAMKLMIISLLFSLLYLMVVVSLGIWSGGFAWEKWLGLMLDFRTQAVLFWVGFLAFAVKVPALGLHIWLTDAHPEAPTFASVILSALMLKFGIYGLIKWVLPIFPDASMFYAPLIVGLSVLAVLIMGLIAWQMDDIKKWIAYSSIAHMGLILVGVFMIFWQRKPWQDTSVQLLYVGVMMQMLAHALNSSGLFLGFGLLYRRLGKRGMRHYKGLFGSMPYFSILYMVVILSNLALPMTAGFVGELMICIATIATSRWVALFLLFSVVIGALYNLEVVKKMFFGVSEQSDTDQGEEMLKNDIGVQESYGLLFIVVLIVSIGLMPGHWVDVIKPSTNRHLALTISSKLQ